MNRSRYRRIVLFFARNILSFIFWDIILTRIGFRKLSRQTRSQRVSKSAVAFRALAIDMGGVLIKVGQFLSTRVDVLPPEFTQELAGLQDEVPPANFEDIREVAESEFGLPISNMYADFDVVPLAAASLGQVHRAKIVALGYQRDAEKNPDARKPIRLIDVVVKVQRPDIETIIKTDLSALQTVGNWLKRYRPISRRADVPALLAEFTRILYEEIDYLAEGGNAERFAENFANQPGVRVPSVIWTHTTKRVLTLENVWGIKITDYQAINDAGIDRSEVASRLIDTYLKQIFEDGFFHADPHPGNLFINPLPRPLIDAFRLVDHPVSDTHTPWQLTFVDFGMVGRVPENLKTGLRELLIGVGTKDAKRVIGAYQKMGILLPGADMALLEKAGTELFERFWGQSMTQLSQISYEEMRSLTLEYRELIFDLPFQVPQNLIFLIRCVAILSGICTGIDPNFNVFEHVSPYAQNLITKEARVIPSEVIARIGAFTNSFLNMPGKVEKILQKIETGEISVRTPDLIHQYIRLEGSIRRVTWGIIFASLLLGSIQLYLDAHEVLAAILLGGAITSLLITLLSGRPNRR